MDFNLLNNICMETVNFYEYRTCGRRLFSYECLIKMEKKIIENIKYLDSLNINYIFSKIKDVDKYYYIYYYYYLINEDLKEDNNILHELIKINKTYATIFNILMMNRKINDDIVLKILDFIKNNETYLGTKPFDYRYHILRRDEISDEIKNKVLNTYPREELNEVLEIIIDDFTSIITNISEIEEDKTLKEEYNVIKVMKKMNK